MPRPLTAYPCSVSIWFTFLIHFFNSPFWFTFSIHFLNHLFDSHVDSPIWFTFLTYFFIAFHFHCQLSLSILSIVLMSIVKFSLSNSLSNSFLQIHLWYSLIKYLSGTFVKCISLEDAICWCNFMMQLCNANVWHNCSIQYKDDFYQQLEEMLLLK